MDKHSFAHKLKNEPIINSHAHHRPDFVHHGLDLEGVLRNSYVAWCGKLIPEDVSNKGAVDAWLKAVRSRSYFVWLEKSLMELYEIEQPLSANSWSIYDEAIINAHQDKTWHLNIQRKNCGYEAVVQETYWNPGQDNGHPEIFKAAYRFNSFFYGYDFKAKDHNGLNIQIMHNRSITSIEEYVHFLSEVLHEAKVRGSVGLKCALAYDRSLHFPKASAKEAQKGMEKGASLDDIQKFQSYIFDHVCSEAARLNLPIQVHTGLGLMKQSGAIELQSLIERNPDTKFLLMHGSFPWVGDIAGLTHVYPNVWADICWLPIISTTAASNLLHQLIDVCDADRVIWGCDTHVSEESFGAKLAFLHVLSSVLQERIDAGLMHRDAAEEYAKAIMHDNAAKVFNL